MSQPGFTATSSIYERGDAGSYYTGRRDAHPKNLVVPMLAIGIGGAGVISRCGAACKCCSSDGNAHCCQVCDRCVPYAPTDGGVFHL